MIILAHDGSVYGDWVAQYALNFAATETDRKLLVLHVLDGKISRDLMTSKLAQLETICSNRDIEFIPQLLPLDSDVYRCLRHAIPHEPDALLICGTRIKARKRAFLHGSIAEQLLRCHQCPVLALRVVQPGLLGSPRHLLMPLAGHTSGFSRVWPIFHRLSGTLQRVHLFRSLHVHHLRHDSLSLSRQRRLLNAGEAYLEEIFAEMRASFAEPAFSIERQVMISHDWPNAVLMQASRLKVQMILLGVSERSLAHRTFYGVGIERVLRETPCDVGIYRGP